MLAIATFVLASLATAVAQAPPPGAPGQAPLQSGPCLDSPREVPRVLEPPVSRAMQVVRIDEVVSTATMTPGETIGFLYTTSDGSTWLGERSGQYMSPASATAINQILAAMRTPGEKSEFPPTSRYGVPTKSPRYFKVHVAPDAMGPLRFQLTPCVAWPAGRTLPDPTL